MPVALQLARAAVNDPQAELAPRDADPGTPAHERHAFAETVRAEIERRKRRLGILSYDDLLTRLADALEDDDSPARQRMRQRWRIVLVDEFQDTDPVQWKVLDRAFSGEATMVLIGDPKQAIYAFRGGDIFTYLEASESAATRRTLATNWRSDEVLVDALQALLGGAALGDPRIAVHPVEAHHSGSRLHGAPVADPLRVRVLRTSDGGTMPIDAARTHIAHDLADDVARLLSSGATFERNPVGAGDVAVLIYSLKHVGLFQQALSDRGIPSVVSGGSSVLLTEAGADWLVLLEALEQPHRSARVRSVALTPFVGLTAEELDAGGDDLTDDVAERVRRWLDMLRARGIAAVHEAVTADGLAARVLARPDGERLLTDLDHLGQVLHDVQHREGLGLPGLLDWLREERRARPDEQRAHPPPRHRRAGGPVRDDPREQGAPVPRRLPAPPLQQVDPRRAHPALPRRRRAAHARRRWRRRQLDRDPGAGRRPPARSCGSPTSHSPARRVRSSPGGRRPATPVTPG